MLFNCILSWNGIWILSCSLCKTKAIMTINEFLKEMAAEGFTGDFRATNGVHTYRGFIDRDGTVKTKKVMTVAESREKINEIFNRTIKN